MPCYIVIVPSMSFTLARALHHHLLCTKCVVNTRIHWCLADVHEAVDMKWMNMRLRKKTVLTNQPASLYGSCGVWHKRVGRFLARKMHTHRICTSKCCKTNKQIDIFMRFFYQHWIFDACKTKGRRFLIVVTLLDKNGNQSTIVRHVIAQ